MEASYPDSGSVDDSRERGPEESEEVKGGAGEGGCDSSFSWAPLPKHLGQVSGTAVVLPLGRDPFVNITSGWTQYDCCPGQGGAKSSGGPKSSVGPLVFCLVLSHFLKSLPYCILVNTS